MRRDKTFFFVSFEQFRETQYVNNQSQTIPTLAYRKRRLQQRAYRRTPKVIGVDPSDGKCWKA